MEIFVKRSITQIILLIWLTLCLLSFVQARKHKLKLEHDDRDRFQLSSFGFLKNGRLSVNVTKFMFQPDVAVDNYTFGFTLDKSNNLGVSDYVESNTMTCILNKNNPDLKDMKDNTVSIIFFRMLPAERKIVIERRGSGIENLPIKRSPGTDHFMQRRQAGSGSSIASDSYLFARAKRAVVKRENVAVPGNTKQTDPAKNDDQSATTAKPTKAGENSVKSTTTTSPEPALGTNTGADDKTETEEGNQPAANQIEASSVMEIPMSFDQVNGFSAYFSVEITDESLEGMYNLYFHNCHKSREDKSISLSLFLIEENDGNYLSAGEMPIPYLFFILAAVYFICGLVWFIVLRKANEEVYKMHYLMLSVVLVKSLACLFHAMNSHFIQNKGFHEEAWAVLYYIAYLMRGALLFITILLIGAGWAFIKHVLSDKEKKLFLVVIPLQVLDNIAWIIVEESEEGQSTYTYWKQIFIIIDLVCCGAILFPVVWSIRHLQEASTVDGKAAISLTKLRLFRQFYIMVVCYIYFTRVIVYLLKITVPFRYEWLEELFKEMATILFFVVTGYKFRPAPDNPYLQVPQEDEEELEMEEVITKSGAFDGVKRVNQGNQHEATVPKQRESSHEYD